MNTEPAVLARVGETFIAFPVVNVREVIDETQTTKVPLAPDHILGLLNLRGEVVSIVDARILLGLPQDREEHNIPVHLLLTHGGETKSLLVDEVLEVIRPEEREIVGVPPGLGGSLEAIVVRVVRQTTRLILVCSVMALLHQISAWGEAAENVEEQ